MAVTRDDVFKTCEHLQAQGQKVSVRALRNALDRGSHSTLLPLLREWEQSQAEMQCVGAVPEDVVTVLARAFGRGREAAHAANEERARRAEQASDDLALECSKLEAGVAAEAAAHEATKAELAATKGVASQLVTELAQCRRDLQREREIGEEARSRSASVALIEKALETAEREVQGLRSQIHLERDLRSKSECQAAANHEARLELEKRISELRQRAEIGESHLGGLRDVIRTLSQQRRRGR